MIVSLDYNEKKNACHIALSDADVRDRLYYVFSAPNEAKKFVLGPRHRTRFTGMSNSSVGSSSTIWKS